MVATASKPRHRTYSNQTMPFQYETPCWEKSCQLEGQPVYKKLWPSGENYVIYACEQHRKGIN
jgi:hypothetical protein